MSWGRGTLVLDPRENGPRGYANGGFACGGLARFVRSAPVEVTLRAPVPVGVPLAVKARLGGGAELLLRQVRGQEVLAEAVPVDPFLAEPPYRPTPDEARAAWAAHPFRGLDLPLSDCVVCGAERLDGLRICFGPVPDHPELMASPFVVPEAFCGDRGELRIPAVWGALDCPSYPAEAVRRDRFALLGRLAADLRRPVLAGEELVAVGWTESVGNRSMRTASALLAGDEIVASARAVWVEAKPDAV
ncbi:hypothetical protein [Nakamurella sp.]|uniref:hypothetical protein n=1 Tax=Nakamurella sp. TaxID=1869182 RepID=UPI003B3A1127